MTALLAAVLAGAGTHLLFTRIALGQRELRPAPRNGSRRAAARRDWLVQAGLADVPLQELALVIVSLMVVTALSGYAVFGGILPSVVLALFAATLPIASY